MTMKDFFSSLYSLSPRGGRVEEMRRYAEANGVPIMLPDAERFMRTIVALGKPRAILEIGTAIGYSGCVMLDCCPSAKLYTIEMDEEAASVAAENFSLFGVADRVTQFLGDAREIVHKMTGCFDFVFMDGPKGQYADFLHYIKNMLASGGALLADNVLFHGYVENLPDKKDRAYGMANNMNKFLKSLFSDGDFESVILDVGDGLSLSVKK